MMKNKKRVELNKLDEEPATLSVSNIRERNGVINPAFLPSPDISPEQHHNHHYYNQQNQIQLRNQYNPNPNWSTHVNQNGVDSQTSSWVYNFNQSYIPDSATLPIHSRFKEYGSDRFKKDDHLVYDVDLNEEYEQNRKSLIKRKCCKTLLHLFVWCIIAVSLLGIAVSAAFIFYIEKIAKCSGRASSEIYVPNVTIANIAISSSNTTLSAVGFSESQNVTDRPTTTTTRVTSATKSTLGSDILQSSNIIVTTLTPFEFYANQTSASYFDISSSKSIIIEANNQTTTEGHMSLERDTDRDNGESKLNSKFLTQLSAENNITTNNSVNDNLDAINSVNHSKIEGDFNNSQSNDSAITSMNDNSMDEYFDNDTMNAYESQKAFTDFVTNLTYNSNNSYDDNNNATLDRLNATTNDTIATSASSPLAIMPDMSLPDNDTDSSYTTVVTVINHSIVASVTINITDFDAFKSSTTKAINHETVNLTDILLPQNRTETFQPLQP